MSRDRTPMTVPGSQRDCRRLVAPSSPPGRPARSPTRPCSSRWPRSPPTAARRSRASTSARTAGSSPTSWRRSRSTRRPTRSSRAESPTRSSFGSTRTPPGADRLPRPESLDGLARQRRASWSPRSPGSADMGEQPAERAMLRRVEGWLVRFLGEEARRDAAGFEPWLLEAGFSERRGRRAAGPRDRRLAPARRDRPRRPRPDGRALVLDYKLSGSVTAREQARGGGEAAAAALPDGRRPSSGTRSRSAASTTRCGEPRSAAPGASSSRTSPRSSPAYRIASHRHRRRGRVRGAARRRPAARRRDRRAGCAPGRSTATPGRGLACAATATAPRFCEFAPICRRDRAPVEPTDEDDEEDEPVSARGRPLEQRARRSRPTSREVMVEAGAGTGKTGVMVDRYCRLVCDEGVTPDAILAFTFTDKAAAELRQRIRAEIERRADAGRASRGLHPARRRLGDDDPRLLQPAARAPTRWRSGSTRASGSSTRPRPSGSRARPSTRRSRTSSPSGDEEREETLAAFDVGGLRAIVIGAHAELRSRGEASRRCPSRPSPTCAGRPAPRSEAAAECAARS